MSDQATVLAGVPAENNMLYHRIRFSVGDPAAWIQWPDGRTLLIVRDIEMARARRRARADQVACPADFEPAGGLSGDRPVATAQALAEALRQRGVGRARTDRSLPMVFAHCLQEAGIGLSCDLELGVLERRTKDEQEIQWLREAQAATESAVELACATIASAEADSEGRLMHRGEVLTSESVRQLIDIHLLKAGLNNPTAIVACADHAADCHEYGSGPLRTSQTVIVDIFPRHRESRYNGDCTRTVVHGEISPEITTLHEAVVAAKAAAIAATRAGVSGEQVHDATLASLRQKGFDGGRPGDQKQRAVMYHGTGHGVGLDVHEPPLLHPGGETLVAGDVVTIEPGLYHEGVGGVRVEDMVVVTETGIENLNRLHEGLVWA
ncbi:MAG: M24 family metallopeptidase [Phycisphaeraceae bacterium]|nr:M24 family metallopeptidase [Phycisphaeraceae bacterium]